MEKSNYTIRKRYKGSFMAAEVAVRKALKDEGFGILTEIDVKKTLKKKLDIDFPKYKILGACNPPLAFKALQAEKDIGALLPCNVLIYEEGGKTVISITKPTIMNKLSKNKTVAQVAREVEKKLRKVLNQAVKK